jgi:hypothetical protein
MHNGTWLGTGTSEGSATHQTGKNPGSNNRFAFGRQESLITSQRLPSNPIWGETSFSGLGSGAKLCETSLGSREVELFPGNSHK